ncbi:hypothetical protein MNBD_ALPHA11-913 [hydrothermal vent metagenome]|uniref:DUF4167 domain-containing protein n=1 Tax=hydrothermal vent metagenome TaxID=652676 RepID=A0A3B0U5P3_9ZZZZ
MQASGRFEMGPEREVPRKELMRSNQQNKRSRGRNNNHNRKNTNPMTRSYESNGPDVRVRGNAAHVAEKYVQLARDANSSGDSVAAENYLQHAEHYFRIISAAQAQQLAQQQAQAARSEQQQGQREQRQPDNRGDKSGDVQPNIGAQGTEDAQQGENASSENSSSENGAGSDKETTGVSEQVQSKPKRAPRERRPRRRPVAEKAVAAEGTKADAAPASAAPVDAEPASAEPASAVPADATEPMNDPANAPQPDVSELPAFVTADVDSSAAE